MNWSIQHDGENLINNLKGLNATVSQVPLGVRNKIVHFGSVNLFMRWLPIIKCIEPHKKIVVTWFHITPGDVRIKSISKNFDYVDTWHTSCGITKSKLIKLGIPEKKICLIPLGVDTKNFSVPSDEEKKRIRINLGIQEKFVVVGSFQKDGNGWELGLTPKKIKGPDIFCNVVENLAKKYKIFVILTGPARGYVKTRLLSAGIPFLHKNFSDPNDISMYYKAIDLYLITSRVEGGPKSLLESAASGVPLVSTEVGMAPEFIDDGKNGFLCKIEDVDDLVRKSNIILQKKSLRNEFASNGRKHVVEFDWKNIANRYHNEIYQGLL